MVNIGDNNGDADISSIYSLSGNNITLGNGKNCCMGNALFSVSGTFCANKVHLDGLHCRTITLQLQDRIHPVRRHVVFGSTAADNG